MEVCWVEAWNLWIVQGEEPDRYRNVLGLGSPFQSGLKPVVEINLPRAGLRRNIGGVVAGDDEHGVHLMHRGLVHGGKRKLVRWFRSQLIATLDRDEVSELVLVAAFDQPGFLGQIAAFVHSVQRFKSGEPPPPERAWITDQRTREAIEQAFRQRTGREGCAAARPEEVPDAVGRALLSGRVALLPLHLPDLLIDNVQYRWEEGSVIFDT